MRIAGHITRLMGKVLHSARGQYRVLGERALIHIVRNARRTISLMELLTSYGCGRGEGDTVSMSMISNLVLFCAPSSRANPDTHHVVP